MIKAERRRMPPDRLGSTHKFEIRGKPQYEGDTGVVEGYLTANTYDDGSLGEIFVRMAKMGSQVSGFADAWAISVSMLLQTGTSVEDICAKFRGVKFEPTGMTDNPNIRFAQSPVDYIARWLEIKFVDGELAEDKSDEHVCEKEGCDSTDTALRHSRWLCEHHGKGLK